MKKLLTLTLALLLLGLFGAGSVFAAPALIDDGADLLTDAEEGELSLAMQEAYEETGAQIALVTRSSLDEDIEDYAEFLYDSKGYGAGEARDGVLLVLSMDPREFRILCNGSLWYAMGSGGVAEITEDITPYLSAGNYAEAFETYVEDCTLYLTGVYESGEYGEEENSFDPVKSLLIAVGAGLLVGLIYALILKGQLKSVRGKTEANGYVLRDSMNLTRSGDYFMYRNVTRTQREQSSSSSRSGGSSRGGGGGRF